MSECSNKAKLEFKNTDKAEGFNSHSNDFFIQADGDRIMQVISNLLENALKFTSEGVVSVDVAERKDNKEVVVRVEDTGSGIDPEIFTRLFTKFSSKSFNGTGLGLYIV